MTRYRDQDENEEDWEDDGDADLDDDQDSDEEPTVACPYCKEEILEDSPRCPYCERYISDEDRAGSRKPFWVIATALFCLGALIWWAFMAF